MNKKELEAFAREAAKSIKTEKDLNSFSQMLTKITVEAALNAELETHLGYGKQASRLSRDTQQFQGVKSNLRPSLSR